MVKLELTPEQVKLVYHGLKSLVDTIWDDPEIVGINDDDYESELEYDTAVMDYIEKNVHPIINEINKQMES